MEISGDSDTTDKSCFQDAVYLQCIHFKRIKATQENQSHWSGQFTTGHAERLPRTYFTTFMPYPQLISQDGPFSSIMESSQSSANT
jgi:hypothetical protein